jgi:hypothetical protein
MGVLALMLVLGLLQELAPHTPEFIITWRVLAVAGILWAIWNLYRTPCPNCRKPIGSVAVWINTPLNVMRSPHCPNCDVSIDRELRRKPR